MPNQLTTTGLQTATQAELVTTFTTAFQAIYGADINLSSDTPDGQMMMIYIQAILDVLALLTQVYNSFDPDNAIGVTLDERVAINGIQRQAGTFTVTNVTIVTSRALSLYGLDQSVQPVYTVQDNAGNNWNLQTTQTPGGAGTYVYSFQAENPGALLTVPNTITTPVSIVLGVTSINNPTTYTTLGLNEETDAALKIRRQQSTSLSSQGYLSGLLAALLNISGMSSAFVYENTESDIDGNGVPGHSIWVITSGTGADADIAQAIYSKRSAGCGMKGTQTFVITQVDGTQFTVNWDVVSPVDLFIKFTTTSLNGTAPPNIAAIKSYLAANFTPGVAQEVNINALATAVQKADPNTLVTSPGFGLSSSGSFSNTLTPAAKNNQFVVSADDIIVLPMQLIPASSVTNTGGQLTFTGLGGFGTLTYSISVNNSGGSINSSTGLYTAGATPNVTDTIHVVDSLSNTADTTVNVT